jgi:predicted anti-sigma-YlaC factor YlaD
MHTLDAMDIDYHMRALEEQFRATTPAERRAQLRIARAAARGARRGRGRRWDVASVAIAALLLVVFVGCAGVAIRAAATMGQHWIDVASN